MTSIPIGPSVWDHAGPPPASREAGNVNLDQTPSWTENTGATQRLVRSSTENPRSYKAEPSEGVAFFQSPGAGTPLSEGDYGEMRRVIEECRGAGTPLSEGR